MPKFGLHFGAFADSLKDQILAQDIAVRDEEDVEHWQRDADAITRLRIRGIVTDAEGHRAHKRLMKKITTGINGWTELTRQEAEQQNA